MNESIDDVIRELTKHCGDGRLTLDELEDRITEAYAATTDDELRHVLRELPVTPKATPRPVADRPAAPSLPPLPSMPEVALPRRGEVNVNIHRDREWEKSVGTLFTLGGFVLLFNGMFWLAMLCWFVLPGLVLRNKCR